MIDVLTIVHHNIKFDDAEKNSIVENINETIQLKLVSYDFFKEIKLKSLRTKDLLDISQLEKLRKSKYE